MKASNGETGCQEIRRLLWALMLLPVSASECRFVFLGTNAIHPERGLTDNDWEVVQVKQTMIASSAKVACLTISEKLNSAQPIKGLWYG